MQLYLNILKEAVVRLTYRIESLTMLSNEERYKELLKLNPNFLKKSYAKHIASYLGITNVSLSRIIKKLTNIKNYHLLIFNILKQSTFVVVVYIIINLIATFTSFNYIFVSKLTN